jgi:hypothetical protein
VVDGVCAQPSGKASSGSAVSARAIRRKVAAGLAGPTEAFDRAVRVALFMVLPFMDLRFTRG